MAEQSISERILAARFGSSDDPCAETFVVISVSGEGGRHALAQLNAKFGPLEGRVAGLFRPCRMEQRLKDTCVYLFGLPTDIVPRARLRVRQGDVAPGLSFTIKPADPKEFRWAGEEPEGKRQRGICMDAYPPPQLSAEWVNALIEKPAITPFRVPAATTPGQAAPTAAAPLRPAVTPSSPVIATPAASAPRAPASAFKTPKAFSLRVVGEEGKRSLAKLERRFGRVPAQIRCGGPQQVLVFPISPEAVPSAIEAEGEIAPGLFLQREKVFVPHAPLASAATAWLKHILAVTKK